jgi:hypothetical protein
LNEETSRFCEDFEEEVDVITFCQGANSELFLAGNEQLFDGPKSLIVTFFESLWTFSGLSRGFEVFLSYGLSPFEDFSTVPGRRL